MVTVDTKDWVDLEAAKLRELFDEKGFVVVDDTTIRERIIVLGDTDLPFIHRPAVAINAHGGTTQFRSWQSVTAYIDAIWSAAEQAFGDIGIEDQGDVIALG